jgi:hypothetical protein
MSPDMDVAVMDKDLRCFGHESSSDGDAHHDGTHRHACALPPRRRPGSSRESATASCGDPQVTCPANRQEAGEVRGVPEGHRSGPCWPHLWVKSTRPPQRAEGESIATLPNP